MCIYIYIYIYIYGHIYGHDCEEFHDKLASDQKCASQVVAKLIKQPFTVVVANSSLHLVDLLLAFAKPEDIQYQTC